MNNFEPTENQKYCRHCGAKAIHIDRYSAFYKCKSRLTINPDYIDEFTQSEYCKTLQPIQKVEQEKNEKIDPIHLKCQNQQQLQEKHEQKKMENILATTESPELAQIEPSKAEQIKAVFIPMADALAQIETEYNEIVLESKNEITDKLSKKARVLRLSLSKIRNNAEKARKEQKEEFLRAGKAIDGVSNILKWALSSKESVLQDIEDHQERIEAERIRALQEYRVAELSPYCVDAKDRLLSSMEQDVWDAYLSAKKQEYFDRIEAEKRAEEEAQRKAEEERAERERIKTENERLQKEAQELKAKAEAERKEREEAEREAKRIADEQLRAERMERERIEAELKAKAEAERKEREEAERKLQAELAKGDIDKMSDLVSDLETLSIKYSFDSERYISIYQSVQILLAKTITFINDKKAKQ